MLFEEVEVRVKEIVAEVPAVALPEAGAVIVKSLAGAAVTTSTTFTEWEIAPDVAVMVRG
jgi:hypothetical protein